MPTTTTINVQRQRATSRLLARHARVDGPDGEHVGCRCTHPTAATRTGYYLHVAEIVELLLQEVLDATFGSLR